MQFYKNGYPYSPVSEYIGKEVIVAIDASKTNTAMFVADKLGNILDDYELSGEAKDEVLHQCYQERQFLSTLFTGTKVLFGGIEDIITKKDSKGISRGMMEHESRFKITAIFISIICYFQDNHQITLELINNWSWKSHTLPEEFRTGVYAADKKGSLAYHKKLGTKYANRSDDTTDAYQILQYMKQLHGLTGIVQISGPKEITDRKYNICIYSEAANTGGCDEFTMSDDCTFGIDEIAAFIVNRIDKNKTGFVKLPSSYFNIHDIYKYANSNCYQQCESNLILAVGRI